jgi:hypothetical protein
MGASRTRVNALMAETARPQPAPTITVIRGTRPPWIIHHPGPLILRVQN